MSVSDPARLHPSSPPPPPPGRSRLPLSVAGRRALSALAAVAAAAGGLRVGSPQPLFPCRVCGRTFTNRSSLSHHRTVHRGRTTCALCGRTLSRMGELWRHLRVMHGCSLDEAARAPRPAGGDGLV